MPKNNTSIAVITLLLLLATVKLAILIWSVDKGFEVTDEGYYLLWFHSAHLYAPDMHLNYYYLVQMLFGWVEWDITAMRIGGIVTEVGAVLILGYSVTRYVRVKLPQLHSPVFTTALFTAALSVIFTAEHPRSLSYDSVTHLLMSIGCGMLLLRAASDSKPKAWLSLLCFTGLGVVIAGQLLVKFSSAILLVALWVGISLLTPSKKQNTLAIIGVAGGLILFFATLFTTQIGLEEFLRYYRISYERIAQLGYSPTHIVLNTYLGKDAVHFAQNIGPGLVAFWGCLYALRRISLPARVALSVSLSISVFAAQAILLPANYFPQWHYRFIDLLLLFFISGIYIVWRFTKADKHIILLTTMLFSLPLICAIGSAINLAMSLFSYLPAWAMLVLIIWQYIRQQTGALLWPLLAFAFVILGSSAIFLQVYLYPSYLPHGMAASMFEQTEQPLAFDQVKLDKPTATFVTKTEQLLSANGYQPGDYILALYDLPGLVYLLQGYSPQVPWYFGETTRATVQESIDNTCWHINDITETNVYVVKPASIHPQVANCLSSSKLNFPASYTLTGTVYNTYCKCEIEVWAPKQ